MVGRTRLERRPIRLRLLVGLAALALAGSAGGLEAQASGGLQVRARVARAEAGMPVLTVARTLADSVPRGRAVRRDLRLATVTVVAERAVADSLDKPRRSRIRRVASIQFLKN